MLKFPFYCLVSFSFYFFISFIFILLQLFYSFLLIKKKNNQFFLPLFQIDFQFVNVFVIVWKLTLRRTLERVDTPFWGFPQLFS